MNQLSEDIFIALRVLIQMFNPQKLHPISYITGIIDVIKQNIFTFIILVGFNIWNFDFTEIRHYIGPSIFYLSLF